MFSRAAPLAAHDQPRDSSRRSCRARDADGGAAELLTFSPAGVEEIEIDARTVEYVLYGAPGELPSDCARCARSWRAC